MLETNNIGQNCEQSFKVVFGTDRELFYFQVKFIYV